MALQPVDKIWMDGELVDWDKANVHVLTHSLHYGTGIFEGIRCYETPNGPAVFRLTDHMKRFERSGRMLTMDLGYSVEQMVAAVKQTVAVNHLPSCYLRPLAFRGYGFMGVDPSPAPVNIIIGAWSWDTYLGAEALESGIDVGVSSWRQRGANATPPAIKATGNYLNSALAKIEANQHGYAEAVLLNEAGHVCEGTGENIFIVKNGVLQTPPLSDGVLEGITRDSIMKIARDKGIEVREASLVRSDLYTADEVFMTGSAAEVVPVRAVDGRTIGSDHSVTMDFQSTYFRIVRGQEPAYSAWLEYVG